MLSIDLNSDLGESFGPWKMGDDAALLDIVSSANNACAIGAHVGNRDLAGFGRRNMDPSSEELVGDVIYQIGALQGIAKAAGTRVSYVKPHGALYNTIAIDQRQAADVIAAIRAIDPSLVLMALAGSQIVEQARTAGLTVVAEAFADRAYTPEGNLVSRRENGSVLHDPELVAARMVRMVREGVVEAIDGTLTRIEAQSICVHGDSPGAVAIARRLRELLEASDLAVRPFTAATERA
jgi:UPF0271 protein